MAPGSFFPQMASSTESTISAKPKDTRASASPSIDRATKDKAESVESAWHTFKCGSTRFSVDRKYKLVGALGRGSYAVVCCAEDTETKQRVAIKKVMDLFGSKTDTIRLLREIQILRHLSGNRHIVSIKDLMTPAPSERFDHIYLVLGYMPADLHKVIHSSNKLTNKHICYMVYQILCALRFMHSAGIVHRDLKPSNVLVNRTCHIRVCDFGLARDLEDKMCEDLTQYVVTRWYRAPEVICANRYDERIDIWSVGCILAEMLNKKALFPGEDYVVQMKLMIECMGCPAKKDLDFIDLPQAQKWITNYILINGPRIKPMPFERRFPGQDPRCLDLLRKILVINPHSRLTVDRALAHRYFRKIRNHRWEAPCDRKFTSTIEQTRSTKAYEAKLMVLEQLAAYRPKMTEVWRAKIPSDKVKADKKESAKVATALGTKTKGSILNKSMTTSPNAKVSAEKKTIVSPQERETVRAKPRDDASVGNSECASSGVTKRDEKSKPDESDVVAQRATELVYV